MKMIPHAPGLLAFAIALTLLTTGVAQETTVAVGYVNSAGNLVSSANPYGGTISANRPNTGEFHITLDAPGAFTGSGIGDFMIQSTVRSSAASDRSSVTEIDSVTPDSLTVIVYVSDVEDSANLSVADPVNASFHFVIHRVPNGAAVNPASRYLFATGAVSSNGTLWSGAAADGSLVATERTADGDYLITFTSPVGFSGDSTSRYLVFVTTRTSNLFHDTAAVGSVDGFANNQLFITVNTADVQTANDDNPVAEDHAFQFAIYRTRETASAGVAESQLLLGMASVDGSNGLLRRGVITGGGGFVTSERSGNGIYRVVLHAPGRFAGRTIDEFAVQATINNTIHNDDIAAATPFLIDPHNLTIEVRTNDVETNGQLLGVGVNNDFFLTIHDNSATSQPDLRIGRSAGLTTMKGNGLYNGSGADQTLNVRTSASRRGRFFFAVENDGNVTDSLRVNGKGPRRHLRSRTFRLTGGRQNVTAEIATAGHLAPARPAEAIVFESRPAIKPASSRKKAKFRLSGRSERIGTSSDAALAIVRRTE